MIRVARSAMRIRCYSHVNTLCILARRGSKLMHCCDVFGLAIVGTNTYLSCQGKDSPTDNSD